MNSDWLNDNIEAAPPRRWPVRWGMAASGFVGVALLAAFYVLFDTRDWFWTKGGAQPAGLPGLTRKEPLLGATALAADDPAVRFSETHVGQIVFSTTSDTCRRHLFDNRTGRSYWVDDLPCGRKAEPIADDEPPHRLNALRKSFQR